MTHPKPERREPLEGEAHVKLPDVDDYLSPDQENQLRTSTTRVAWVWQRDHGCPNFDCLRCRVGRALAVLSKGLMDANAAVDILCALIPDLVQEQENLEPVPDVQRYEEICHLLIKALDNVEQCGVNMASAMGTPAAPGTGMRFN